MNTKSAALPWPPRRRGGACRVILAVTAWWMLAAAPGLRAQASGPGEAKTESVVTKATPQFIEPLLGQLGLPFKADKDTYLINIGEVKILLVIDPQGSLMLYVGFKGIKVTPLRINEWNKKYRFSRAYLDDANDPVLMADLDFDGGVTTETVKNFITVFKGSMTKYSDFLKKESTDGGGKRARP